LPRPHPSGNAPAQGCRRRRTIALDAIEKRPARDNPPHAPFLHRPVAASGTQPRPEYSNSAIDSTCDVCGNMLAMPAPRSAYPFSLTSTAASRASVAGLHDT